MNSIRNSIIAVFLQVVSLLIGFFSRKIFLDCLGTEVLGLNTTATSLLNFLNLAELGIGTAIAVTLYKPMFADDRRTIREVVALQGWLYRRIAMFVICGGIVLMFFFPLIFRKMELPMWYAYASFGVLLFSAMLSYFFNYKEIVLSADQKDYKIQLSYRVVIILKFIAQMFAVKLLPHPYIWWLVLEAVFALLASLSLNRAVYKTYQWLKDKVENPSGLADKYPEVVTKVKQMFFHRIGGFVLTQTSPLIIYGYASLTLVALYGNYLIITNNLTFLLAAMFSGLAASVGNMVAEGDGNLIMKVFRELFSTRFLAVAACSICIWFLADPFVSVWLGREFLLDRVTLLLIIVMFFLNTMRLVVDTFLNAYGLYRDIWAPIAETVLNLGCSITLGYFYDLHGILMGVIISQLLIIFIWKPYFLFRCGFKESILTYIGIYAKHIVLGAVSFAAVFFVNGMLPADPSAGLPEFLCCGMILFATALLVLGGLCYALEPGMRSFVKRLIGVGDSIKDKRHDS